MSFIYADAAVRRVSVVRCWPRAGWFWSLRLTIWWGYECGTLQCVSTVSWFHAVSSPVFR